MNTQNKVKEAFELYLREYGEGYDQFSFIDCVVATLCNQADAEQLIAFYTNAIRTLREHFPSLELETRCPNCADASIVQRARGSIVLWVAKDWIDPETGIERELDYCPACGYELLDSDECGRVIEANAVKCLCGHAAASHANSDTECNALDCPCRTFQLDYETATVP